MFNIFNIFKSAPHSFPSKLEFATYDNLKFIKRVPVKTNNDKVVYLESLPNKDFSNSQTLITNRWFNILGVHEYDMFQSLDSLEGYTIDVVNKKQKQGIGEILRLASLIEMKENGIKEIRIKSIPKALLFHLKYKFKPSLNNQSQLIKNVLTDISKDNGADKTFSETAEKLLNDINKNGFNNRSQGYYGMINSFILQYAQGNSQRWRDTLIHNQIPLILTESDVKKHASFYNSLFKKHGLDYTI